MRNQRKKNRVFRYIVLAIVFAAFAWAATSFVATPKTSIESSQVDSARLQMGPRCSVIRVVDGDTIHVRCEGKKESVRLLRINTPERGRPGYREATEALEDLVDREEVQLLFEGPGATKRDRFGRILAYVAIGERNLNVEMVRLGWTRFWTRYGEGSLSELFRTVENEARSNGEGLWTEAGWNKQ